MSGYEAKDYILSCPFCEFEDNDASFLSQHVAFCHPEDPKSHSPHRAQIAAADLQQLEGAEDSSTDLDNGDIYITCPHGCGETVVKTELQLHLDLHVAESAVLDESGGLQLKALEEGDQGADELNGLGDANDDNDNGNDDDDLHENLVAHPGDIILQAKTTTASHGRRRHRKHGTKSNPDVIKGRKRLGRKELGPYAHERQMPSWLRKLLQSGPIESTQTKIGSNGLLIKGKDLDPENETSQVIPALIELCRHDSSVQRAFFCSPKVRHIFKFLRESGFCGYRNIQMLISHIIDARRPGYEHFSGQIPSILQLQEMIEQAWDMGFNSNGRIETGGIKGTRKYIGTPEAHALFQSLGIKCTPSAFAPSGGYRAYDMLFQDVANYFRSGCPSSLLESDEKILETDLPPIYLQHRGHSLTIVGFEIDSAGGANLLVFDPMFRTSPAIQRLIGKFVRPSDPSRVLKAWRRGVPYLQKYKEFEVLKLITE